MDRRRFVQISVGAAAAGTLAGAGSAFSRPLFEPRPPPLPPVRYFGAVKRDGPAPRGVPFIPVRLTEDGVFEGVPFLETGRDAETDAPLGVDVLPWYRYCDHADAPGLDPDAEQDNRLRYFTVDDPTVTVKPWFADRADAPVRPEEFPDVEMAAAFKWRSEGATGKGVLTGVLIRYPRDALRHVSDPPAPASPLTEEEYAFLVDRFFVTHGDSVFVGVSTFCTHFCCTAGFKHTNAARTKNAWERMFCACHGSVYEPREPAAYTFQPEA